MNANGLAKAAGTSFPFVTTLQKKYGLPVGKDYSEGYAVLIRKLVYLTAYSVGQKDIATLLTRERKLLELLNVDSHTESALWFEDLCSMKCGPGHLLLTGYDLGHAIGSHVIQTGLDFADREQELFSNQEMGADVLCALRDYSLILEKIQEHVRREQPVLKAALRWTGRAMLVQRGSFD